MTDGGRIPLLCLLPVRNGAAHLERYLACAQALGASVIALDDGSTDDTRARLEAAPSVLGVLTNPVRPDFTGWDDARNRARLLEACAAIAPRWVLWLDVDELIADSDIPLLSDFLRDAADPRHAYGFEVLRMIDDAEHFDRARLWVYRLFAYRPGYTLPTERLHFEPVPDEIPPGAWRRTRLRILHFSSVSPAARAARYEKYRQADPDCRWQDSYADLLDAPEHVWRLRPLPSGQPIVIA